MAWADPPAMDHNLEDWLEGWAFHRSGCVCKVVGSHSYRVRPCYGGRGWRFVLDGRPSRDTYPDLLAAQVALHQARARLLAAGLDA